MLFSFMFGFLLGVISLLLLTLFLVVKFVFLPPKDDEERAQFEANRRPPASLDAHPPTNTNKVLPSSALYTTEPAQWFNAALDRVLLELIQTDQMRQRFWQWLTDRLNAKDKPEYVGKFYVKDLVFGTGSNPGFPHVDEIKAYHIDNTLQFEFSLKYIDGLRFTVTTEISIYLKDRVLATIPVALTISIVSLTGRLRAVIPSGYDPLCLASFLTNPEARFKVDNSIGGKVRFNNIPKLSEWVIGKIQRSLADLVIPKGMFFHIPIPRIRQPQVMTYNKFMRLKAEREKVERERVEKERAEAAAAPPPPLPARTAANGSTGHAAAATNGTPTEAAHAKDTAASTVATPHSTIGLVVSPPPSSGTSEMASKSDASVATGNDSAGGSHGSSQGLSPRRTSSDTSRSELTSSTNSSAGSPTGSEGGSPPNSSSSLTTPTAPTGRRNTIKQKVRKVFSRGKRSGEVAAADGGSRPTTPNVVVEGGAKSTPSTPTDVSSPTAAVPAARRGRFTSLIKRWKGGKRTEVGAETTPGGSTVVQHVDHEHAHDGVSEHDHEHEHEHEHEHDGSTLEDEEAPTESENAEDVDTAETGSFEEMDPGTHHSGGNTSAFEDSMENLEEFGEITATAAAPTTPRDVSSEGTPLPAPVIVVEEEHTFHELEEATAHPVVAEVMTAQETEAPKPEPTLQMPPALQTVMPTPTTRDPNPMVLLHTQPLPGSLNGAATAPPPVPTRPHDGLHKKHPNTPLPKLPPGGTAAPAGDVHMTNGTERAEVPQSPVHSEN